MFYHQNILKIVILFVMLSSLFLPFLAHAYYGDFSNPIYVEIEETPSQIYQRQQEELEKRQEANQREFDKKLEDSRKSLEDYSSKTSILRSQYPQDYQYCYSSYCANKDLANPYTSKQCLTMLEYCLQTRSRLIQKEVVNILPAPTAQPKSNQQLCQDAYRNSIWTGQTDSQGKIICDCSLPYEWSSDRTSCVLPAVVCGPNSKQIGSNCFCNDGYILNGGSCVTYTQSCQLKYGSNSYGDKQYCYCLTGYEWNTDRTACITNQKAIEPTTIKQDKPLPQKTIKPTPINKEKLLSKPQAVKTIAADDVLVVTPKIESKNERRGILIIMFESVKGFFNKIFK